MIHSFEYSKKNIGEVGQVTRVRRSIAWATDLKGAKIGEVVTFENGVHGLVWELGTELTQLMVLSREPVYSGLKVARTGEPLKITVSDQLLSYSISSLGYTTYEGKEGGQDTESRVVEAPILELSKRSRINRQLVTGISIVDQMMPLGMGQRELVMGDRKTGKSHFTRQVVLSQAQAGNLCVIALIGKPKGEILAYEQFLRTHNIDKSCVMVVEDAQASASEIYLAPYAAMTIAEYFRDQGRDVLVVLDDLSRHAQYYREISLTGGAFPGRDSYPGDIFYVHSHLMERAGNFLVKDQQVSITCLPIIETVEGDFSGYLPTNLMSMTDGHLYFSSQLYFSGQRPAIDPFLSVTRVGRQTQSTLVRNVGQELIRIFKESQELQRFLRFGAEMSPSAKQTLKHAQALQQLFNQYSFAVKPIPSQLLSIGLVLAGASSEQQKVWQEQLSSDSKLLADWESKLKNYQTVSDLVKGVRELGGKDA